MMQFPRAAALSLSALLLSQATALAATTTITAAGSTALQPLVQAAAEQYEAKHPNVQIEVEGGGSRLGVMKVESRSVDLGNSDTIAKYPNLVDHRVAVIGFAVVADPNVSVTNLTRQQIQDIFSGKITNWKDVGGKNQSITVINRPRTSGTRAVFAQVMMDGQQLTDQGMMDDETSTVVSALKNTPGAISYVAFSGALGQGLREIAIDGVAPSERNVLDGKYPLWSYEHVYTNGQPNGVARDFLNTLTRNSKLIRSLGYIPTTEMKVAENSR